MQEVSPLPSLEEADDLKEYCPVSQAAVAGLLLGAASALALVSPLWLWIPLVGAWTSWRALAAISDQNPPPLGRKAAWIGLALAVSFGCGSAANQVLSRWFFRQEARQIALQWFTHLQNREPHDAFELARDGDIRQSLKQTLEEYYVTHEYDRLKLGAFVAQPPVQVLLALGQNAVVRHYETETIETNRGVTSVTDIYVVTFLVDNQRKSYFMRVQTMRKYYPMMGKFMWRVFETQTLGQPPASWNPPAS